MHSSIGAGGIPSRVDDAQDALDPIGALQAFIDDRWEAAKPKFYRPAVERPRVHPEITPSEARDFLAALAPSGSRPALLQVDDGRKMRSDRFPPKRDGSRRAYNFFEHPGRLRLETIVHFAAAARLRDEFGWPDEQLVFESPTLVDDCGTRVLHQDALDILLLDKPHPRLSAQMRLDEARSGVVVETKATARLLQHLLREMHACRTTGHPEHDKCVALQVLRPRFFLAVAASETWRLFTVVDRDGRAVLGEELRELEHLRFRLDSPVSGQAVCTPRERHLDT